MSRHVLYAYVDGYDLEDVAAHVVDRCEQFIAARTWVCDGARIVDRRSDDASADSTDLRPWDVGLNVALPDPDQESAGWFADVQSIAEFLADLHVTTGREFIIGIRDDDSSVDEDLFCVDSSSPNMQRLRAAIGVGETE